MTGTLLLEKVTYSTLFEKDHPACFCFFCLGWIRITLAFLCKSRAYGREFHPLSGSRPARHRWQYCRVLCCQSCGSVVLPVTLPNKKTRQRLMSKRSGIVMGNLTKNTTTTIYNVSSDSCLFSLFWVCLVDGLMAASCDLVWIGVENLTQHMQWKTQPLYPSQFFLFRRSIRTSGNAHNFSLMPRKPSFF